MPIYEYHCTACDQRFSTFYRSITSAQDAAPPPCPACSSSETRRVLSSFAVHGPSGADPAEVAHERKQAERAASITPKEQISSWQSAKGSD